jgi:uncharacterized protein YceH (UPF0502 family)
VALINFRYLATSCWKGIDMPEQTSWPALSTVERRILGVLVEKAKTTPDVYPLSINSIVTGSNQKSNRDPLLNLADLEVEDALPPLQQKGLVTRITGGRVERWRHNLYEVWKVNKVELAILAELLLRGAQTEGDLRGRASRMEPIDDLAALRSVLGPLAERGLVVYLGPEGRRGTQLTHGFHIAKELENLKANVRPEEPEPAAAVPKTPSHLPALEGSLAEARQEIAALRTEVNGLRETMAALQSQLTGLKEALGM